MIVVQPSPAERWYMDKESERQVRWNMSETFSATRTAEAATAGALQAEQEAAVTLLIFGEEN
jgi:hypothetical protein